MEERTQGQHIEANGANIVAESERHGKPRDMFWIWFPTSISVFTVSYGAFLIGFGLSVWQALGAAFLGIAAGGIVMGLVSLVGKRGSAPTMIMSRAAFGVRGNLVPTLVSWLLSVGWEIILVTFAVLTATALLAFLGVSVGTVTTVIALIIITAIVVMCGVFGFNLIQKLLKIFSYAGGALTLIYIILTFHKIDFAAVAALPVASPAVFIGAAIFILAGTGLGFVQMVADYSRYLPRAASSKAVTFWVALGPVFPFMVLVGFGMLLAGSDPKLAKGIGLDPAATLLSVLPAWYVIPFGLVTMLGLIMGAVLDIYSSGLTLIASGLKLKRYQAALVDSGIVLIGTVYLIFFAPTFIGQFNGFLITLGIPISAWAGIIIADVVLRRRDYADAELFDRTGRYGDVRWVSIALIVVGSVVGFGLVTNSAAGWLDWQGYLLDPFGLGGKSGVWAYSNLGVLASLVVGFLGYLVLGRRGVRRQEALPLVPAAPAVVTEPVAAPVDELASL